MELDQTLTDIINQQNIKIHQLENLVKELSFNSSFSKYDTVQSSSLEVNEKHKVFEYICLSCNQLFTLKDIFNHTQQNKDHIDHCIHIDSLKNQLIDINNSSSNSSLNSGINNNNNIYKKRIETLWSSLKRLSTTHSLLNSKINEISNHFKIYHDYLMLKEHSLKKQIQNDIDSINNDITNQINEFKSIINIVNTINNNSSENSKDSATEPTYDNSIPSIIESIQQSESYNSFIDNNKNTLLYDNNNIENTNNTSLFLFYIDNHNRNYKSSLLNPTEINSKSKNINENLYIIKTDPQDVVCDQLGKLIAESIVIDTTPSALVRYGDLDLIKQYYTSNNIKKLDYYNSNSKLQIEIKETIIEILKSNRIDILKYFIIDLDFNIKTQFKYDFKLFRNNVKIDLMGMATVHSSFETIQFIDSYGINNNIKWNYEICLELSPSTNNIKVLQYFSPKVIGIIASDSINNIFVSANAALLGHFDMIEWISKNTPCLFEYQDQDFQFCIDVAAINGHLDIIKWLHENRTEGCTTHAMDNAADNGHLETIKWLHENRTEGCTTDAMDYAAENGYLEIIKWLHENRTEGCTTNAMDWAAHNGHLEIIKWLRHNRTEGCTENAIDWAAHNGHLETIKWLHDNRIEGCTTYAIDFAAKNGHLETIKWLHENRTEGCTTDAMDSAAKNGHLETIKWLHENRTEGCTIRAMNYACWDEHLEIVKWLHENRTEGCSKVAMDFSAEYGQLETIKWLHQNRTEGCTISAMDTAADNGHLEIIKWLHHNRTEGFSTKVMDFAAKNGHLEIIKWLHENRKNSCTENAMNYAASRGHLETIKWLHQNRTEGNISSAITHAESSNEFEVSKWLKSRKNRIK